MKTIQRVLAVAAILWVVGCSDSSPVGNGRERGSDAVALLRVNGENLTAGYVRQKVELAYAKTMVMQGKKLAQGSARDFNAFAMQNFRNYVTEFLLRQDARQMGVVAAPVDVSNALHRLNVETGKNFTKIEEFEPYFPQRFGMLKREFSEQCQLMAYLRIEEGLSEVTDEDIDAYYIYLDKQDECSDKEDRKQREKAAAAYAALQGGMSWQEAVEKYSEDHFDNRGEYGEDWGTWSLENVPFKSMVEQLAKLSVGGTSAPFETDDGLIILRLMDKTEEGRYHLGRILVRLTERTPRSGRDAVSDTLMDGKIVGAVNSAKRRLAKNLRFEYPMGSNFVYRVWDEPPPKPRPERRPANTNVVTQKKG